MSFEVKADGANRKPVGPTCKCSLGSNLVSVTVFEIFRVKILTVHLLTLVRLTPGPKFTKRGDDLADLPPCKMSSLYANLRPISVTKILRTNKKQTKKQ